MNPFSPSILLSRRAAVPQISSSWLQQNQPEYNADGGRGRSKQKQVVALVKSKAPWRDRFDSHVPSRPVPSVSLSSHGHEAYSRSTPLHAESREPSHRAYNLLGTFVKHPRDNAPLLSCGERDPHVLAYVLLCKLAYACRWLHVSEFHGTVSQGQSLSCIFGILARRAKGSRPDNRHVRLAGGWCWFVLREEYCWLVAGGWFVLREKYCWLVSDKPSEQGESRPALTREY
jgi:hypothetical protein